MQRRSAAARKRNTQGRKRLLELLAMRIPQGKEWEGVRAQLEAAGLDPSEIDFEAAMHFALALKAITAGDAKAYTAIMTVAGLVKEQIELSSDEPIEIKFG